MQRYDLMTYSGVMQVFKRRRRNPYTFAEGVLPKDKTWQVVLMVSALAIGFCAMFVGWWMCAW